MCKTSVVFGLMCLVLGAPGFAEEPVGIDLLVSGDAVYRVEFADLAEAGLTPTPAARLSLSMGGESQPYWLEDDDGVFGPGDSLEFIGRGPRGENSRHDTETLHNVYRLSSQWSGGAAEDKLPVIAREAAIRGQVTHHLERDELRVRFNNRRIDPATEIWYWKRLSVLDAKPFSLPVQIADGDPRLRLGLKLALDLRGWSVPIKDPEQDDHVLELRWNDQAIANVRWSGQDRKTVELRIAPDQIRPGENLLSLKVPRRDRGKAKTLLTDVSLLNWVSMSYEVDGDLASQTELVATGGKGVRVPPQAREVMLYTTQGRMRLPSGTGVQLPGATSAFLVSDQYRTVDGIRRNMGSNWRSPERQADYLLISHGSLLDAARPLAEHHRAAGLSVAEIDVQDVYDEFSHGRTRARAIRDFIGYAYHQWRAPRPRFVLLVGDASWDINAAEHADQNYADWSSIIERRPTKWFGKNRSTPYQDLVASRGLVPTMHMATYEGFAASDTALVAVDGDDWQPDLAVGRIPVVTADEASAVVDKLLKYDAERQRPGLWKRNLLLVTNDQPRMQRHSEKILGTVEPAGLAASRVYPQAAELDNQAHQNRLLSEFDQGQLLVHFMGHGGRYIWRTGPPDLRKNHDLFTLDHLDKLDETGHLPVVLSMTCYSAPFDHPRADSIGEKFLRIPDKGAVGVLAASWRNNPSRKFSADLLQELVVPDTTVGEAILRAKQQKHGRLLVETYNYLGDPATRLALPSQQLRITNQRLGDALLTSLKLPEGLAPTAAQVLVERLDAEGQVIDHATLDFNENPLVFAWSNHARAADARRVRAYSWHDQTGTDALGYAELPLP